MGTSSLFWQQFRENYAAFDPKIFSASTFFAIDTSVALYRVSWRGMGYKTFAANPQDEVAMDRLADEWTDELIDELRCVAAAPDIRSRVAWFFEEKIPKARHLKINIGSDRKKNRALRNMTGQCSPAKMKKCQTAISYSFGRPDWSMTLRIAHKIKQRGFGMVSAVKHSESDHRIARWACDISNQGGQTVVISVDSDYMAFAPPDSVSFMAYPLPHQPDHLKVVHKRDVLKEADMSCLQLVVSFGLAGTDNISAHIEGMGWYKSAQYSRRYIPAEWSAEDFRSMKCLDRFPNLSKWKNSTKQLITIISEEMIVKMEQFGWFPSKDKFEFFLEPTFKAKMELSYLHSFAFALQPCGNHLLRPKVARLVLDNMSGTLSDCQKEKVRVLCLQKEISAKKKSKFPLENPNLESATKGFHLAVRRNGRKNTFGVGISGVKEIPLITGPLRIPQWLDSVKTSDLERIQLDKGTHTILLLTVYLIIFAAKAKSGTSSQGMITIRF